MIGGDIIKKMKAQQTIITLIIAVAVGAGAFFGGMKYQQAKAPSMGINRQNVNAQNRFGGASGQGRQGAGRPIIGDIISTDTNSITIKLADGGSKIILLGSSVTISKTSDGSKDDLKTGTKVGVFGTENSDGSLSAQNIQLNPMFRLNQQGAQR